MADPAPTSTLQTLSPILTTALGAAIALGSSLLTEFFRGRRERENAKETRRLLLLDRSAQFQIETLTACQNIAQEWTHSLTRIIGIRQVHEEIVPTAPTQQLLADSIQEYTNQTFRFGIPFSRISDKEAAEDARRFAACIGSYNSTFDIQQMLALVEELRPLYAAFNRRAGALLVSLNKPDR